MSDQRGARDRKDRFENAFQRLQKDVQRSGTNKVLNSLPAPESFAFLKTEWKGCDTIKLLLGYRPNPNGSMSQAWARIVSSTGKTDLHSSVRFYDEELSTDGTRTVRYPRSASSLLRKATELQPPFCFLQHDPIDEATNVREMLSAVILYLAAVRSIDTRAWQWDEFGESLVKALNYIQSRDTYHQWHHKRKLAILRPLGPSSAAEEEPQKQTENQTNSDQAKDPSGKETPIPSPVDVNEFCGAVRSSGSAMVIKPNTALAKLKQQLGNQKFRILDNIPSMPMTFSRHNLGGSLFPYRMLVGKASYQDTGEIIEVYAYIDHERAKPASMVFMSHDGEGIEQTYDVNLLRDGVDLVGHLEYLNTLKKDSYKDDAKSARTAKLRSLICYYFFIAENEGMIDNPEVDINGGFCKRLHAVCQELGRKDWGGAGSDNDERTDEGPLDNADVQKNDTWPAQHTTGSGADDNEFTRRGESEVDISRIVKLRIRPQLLAKVIESGPIEREGELADQETPKDRFFDDPLAAEPFIEHALTLEVELRPSSQVAREAPQPSTDTPNCHHIIRSTPLGGSKTVDDAVASFKFPMTIADRSAEFATVDRTHADSVGTEREEQDRVSVGIHKPFTKIETSARPIDQRISSAWNLLADGNRDDRNAESVPVDASPVLTPDHSCASSVALSTRISSPVVGEAAGAGRLSRYFAAKSGGNRPPTPEGSAERELKSSAVTVNVSENKPPAFAAVDAIVISDDEDNYSAPLPPIKDFDRTLETESISPQIVVDLTQPSSSPRGKKRKSLGTIHLTERDKDTVAETDGSEWRRKSRNRRK